MFDAKNARILVHGSWNGWRSAEIRLADLEDVHWYQPANAPHRLIHGFVRCTDFEHGQLEHQCDGAGPHRIRVCLLKHHAAPSIYREFAFRADARTSAARTGGVWPAGAPGASARASTGQAD